MPKSGPLKYSPPRFTTARKTPVTGTPNDDGVNAVWGRFDQ
ncbi:hypothetical protein OJ996_04510 [Luteolibacter sp. GHJ8]|uniref:Uncharacterized protein n=1 Tax=Luteolibacter rhizosphaerae TaxID=2989719 RepID=A0ABT3FZ23_9BACT|nr:hypothetical protein [Luteolibacter rhizosphaerae]MCW1912822.1 hypothetical protein [Luteolibacter rhizosphaerae]